MLDAIVEAQTERAQRFGGVEALDRPYLDTGFSTMIRKRAGWLCALFLSEMLTASAMQHIEGELQRAITLTLFIPLIMSSGGNSGSQATSLIIRALALGQVRLRDWWRVALRELPAGLVLGAILGLVGVVRITLWQQLGFYDYGVHWPLIALTVGSGLVGIVTFGSLAGSMLPVRAAKAGFRSRQRVRAVRGHAGRCHRADHLFFDRTGNPERHIAVTDPRRKERCWRSNLPTICRDYEVASAPISISNATLT